MFVYTVRKRESYDSEESKLFKNIVELEFEESDWNISIIFKCKEKKRDMYVLQIFRISFEASVYEEEFIDLGD